MIQLGRVNLPGLGEVLFELNCAIQTEPLASDKLFQSQSQSATATRRRWIGQPVRPLERPNVDEPQLRFCPFGLTGIIVCRKSIVDDALRGRQLVLLQGKCFLADGARSRRFAFLPRLCDRFEEIVDQRGEEDPMARPLRIEYEHALYHVTCRGNERRPIHRDDDDFRRRVHWLEQTVQTYGWHLHAFALMPNHNHLFVETPRANLAVGMQYLDGSYAGYFNARHVRVGHVFQGRYKAVVVEEEGPQSGRTMVHEDGHLTRVAVTADRDRFERLFLDALNGRLSP